MTKLLVFVFVSHSINNFVEGKRVTDEEVKRSLTTGSPVGKPITLENAQDLVEKLDDQCKLQGKDCADGDKSSQPGLKATVHQCEKRPYPRDGKWYDYFRRNKNKQVTKSMCKVSNDWMLTEDVEWYVKLQMHFFAVKLKKYKNRCGKASIHFVPDWVGGFCRRRLKQAENAALVVAHALSSDTTTRPEGAKALPEPKRKELENNFRSIIEDHVGYDDAVREWFRVVQTQGSYQNQAMHELTMALLRRQKGQLEKMLNMMKLGTYKYERVQTEDEMIKEELAGIDEVADKIESGVTAKSLLQQSGSDASFLQHSEEFDDEIESSDSEEIESSEEPEQERENLMTAKPVSLVENREQTGFILTAAALTAITKVTCTGLTALGGIGAAHASNKR